MQHPSEIYNTLICQSASFNEKSDHDVKLNWRRQNIHLLNNKHKEENHSEENVITNKIRVICFCPNCVNFLPENAYFKNFFEG